MEAFCLGSSSSGNAYILKFTDPKTGDTKRILVEAGFPYRELVSRAVRQGALLSQCTSCLITHEHSDHAYSLKEVNERLCTVFASEPTLKDRGVNPNQYNTMKDWVQTYVEPHVLVLPFLVDHDAPEPMGFAIRSYGETVCFVNDCYRVLRDLSGIKFDYVFIECNYEDRFMHIEYSDAKRDGDLALIKRYNRIFKAHMGLYGTQKFLSGLDLSKCKAIFLMHLSDRNAREQIMKQEVGKRYPNIKVFVCRKEGGFC
jgi:phosphoribosyl 1,2-cyclic phosphodiesterase